jgi:hypothetical protein
MHAGLPAIRLVRMRPIAYPVGLTGRVAKGAAAAAQ